MAYSRPAFSVSGKSTNTVFSSRSYLSGVVAEQDLVDVEVGVEIELNARVVLQHLEADRVLAADRLLLRIDADVEVVVQQIVVGAISAVFAAQDVGARRRFLGRKNRLARRLLGDGRHGLTVAGGGERHEQRGDREDPGSKHAPNMPHPARGRRFGSWRAVGDFTGGRRMEELPGIIE